jgi:transcriptional regulator with XRE-family HTH domain
MNTQLLEAWIRQHEPQGLTKLAAAAEISIGTVNKILKHGHAPGVDIARRIAKTIDVSLDELCGSDESPGPEAA